MDACCHEKDEELASLRAGHGRTLWIVLVINATFFAIEFCAGILAHSTALLADSLDMLGDSLVYGLSLYVLSRSPGWKVTASIAKGVIMAAFGIGVLIEAVYKTLAAQLPSYETMGLLAYSRSWQTHPVLSFCTGIDPITSTCARRGSVHATM